MKQETCENCKKAFPCQKYCGKCGKLLNAKFPANSQCYFSHLGYKSEGGHKFCPDCGEPLAIDKNTATVISVITKQRREKEACPQKSSEESPPFIEINECPQCQSFNFSRVYGGRHNKKCNECGKYFEENASMIEYLSQ